MSQRPHRIDACRARYVLGFPPANVDDTDEFRAVEIKVSTAKKEKRNRKAHEARILFSAAVSMGRLTRTGWS
jgi:hypothetical protein